jgi:hypothetical protein
VLTVQEGESFSRLQLTGPEDLMIDITLDSQPGQPPTMSVAGPTYGPQGRVCSTGSRLAISWTCSR